MLEAFGRRYHRVGPDTEKTLSITSRKAEAAGQISTTGLTTEEKILIRGIPVWANLANSPAYISRVENHPVEVAVGVLVATIISSVGAGIVEHSITKDRKK